MNEIQPMPLSTDTTLSLGNRMQMPDRIMFASMRVPVDAPGTCRAEDLGRLAPGPPKGRTSIPAQRHDVIKKAALHDHSEVETQAHRRGFLLRSFRPGESFDGCGRCAVAGKVPRIVLLGLVGLF
jgi:hypothetical protein